MSADRRVFVVTPWRGGAHLLEDYAQVVRGCTVVTVNNSPEDAELVAALPALGGTIIDPDGAPRGFSASNNIGYAGAALEAAPDDVIVFLNSDVAGPPLAPLAQIVQSGALYGPAIAQQLVAGVWLPYIDGWCVAATRATWDLLCSPSGGPWDAARYPAFYWEDAALSLEALALGVNLVQAHWPLQHKGGATAGALITHAESFEAQERAFAARVVELLPRIRAAQQPATDMQRRYLEARNHPSDIQHHIPLLYALARGVVVELGTRGGVSTVALLAGVERHGGMVYSIDIDPACAQVAAGHPQWLFTAGSSTDATTMLGNRRARAGQLIDLLFVDTLHTRDHVLAELTLWADDVRPGGAICVHDIETFPGVGAAVRAFVAHRGWRCTMVLPNNGMAYIEVPA